MPLAWKSPTPVVPATFPSPSAEPEGHARKQRQLLDQAYRYLLDQGFGVLELASLDLDDVSAMARLAIPMWDWL